MKQDFSITDHGSVTILYPHTDAARGWIAENIDDASLGWGTGGIVVEPRYVADIVAGMEEAGLQGGETS